MAAVDIAQLLAFAVKNNASDLHLSAGVPPIIRVDGDVKRVNMPLLTHKQVFMDLAQYTRAIISQRLGKSKEGERVAAVEIMLNTPYIPELMLKGDISGVKEAFKSTNEPGMQCFDDALLGLYKNGRVSMEEALANSDPRADLEAKINFG